MTDIPASRALHPASPGGGSRPPLSRDPVVLPGSTIGSMTDQICAIALRERAFLWWWIAMIPAAVLSPACWSPRSSGYSTRARLKSDHPASSTLFAMVV